MQNPFFFGCMLIIMIDGTRSVAADSIEDVYDFHPLSLDCFSPTQVEVDPCKNVAAALDHGLEEFNSKLNTLPFKYQVSNVVEAVHYKLQQDHTVDIYNLTFIVAPLNNCTVVSDEATECDFNADFAQTVSMKISHIALADSWNVIISQSFVTGNQSLYPDFLPNPGYPNPMVNDVGRLTRDRVTPLLSLLLSGGILLTFLMALVFSRRKYKRGYRVIRSFKTPARPHFHTRASSAVATTLEDSELPTSQEHNERFAV